MAGNVEMTAQASKIRYKNTYRSSVSMLDRVCETLIATHGLVAPAAKILDMDPGNLHRYVKHHARAQAAQRIASNAVDDLAESRLFRAIDQGDLKAVIFRLSTKGKHRGYTPSSGAEGDQPRQIAEIVIRVIDAVEGRPVGPVIEHRPLETSGAEDADIIDEAALAAFTEDDL
jgi:hypothetical protein